jgi:hypothetical protein
MKRMFFLGLKGPEPERNRERRSAAMLATVNNLLANKQIPPLDAVQMQDLLQYLFTTAEKMLRIQVADLQKMC